MTKEIILIEDHNQALDAWRSKSFKNIPLVHLDAHIDFGFYHVKPIEQVMGEAKSIADLKRQLEATLLYKRYCDDFEKQLNIGNYIYPAVRDGIVNKFYWIIPGGEKKFKKGLKELNRSIVTLKSKDPFKAKEINIVKNQISTLLYRKQFEITNVFSVPTIKECVLLDIDVDFLLFDSIRNEHISLTKTIGKRKPWIYPKQLVEILKEKFPKVSYITIAYSVNGGFTPIDYKFFGDEIYLRLKNLVDDKLEDIFFFRDIGIALFLKKDFKSAGVKFKEAIESLNSCEGLVPVFKPRFLAHLSFWLFKIYWELNQKKAAKLYFQKAIKTDPSYHVKDNNFGMLYLKNEEQDAAKQEFKKIIYCDARDCFALCGLGDVFLQQKRYREALGKYKKAFRLNPKEKRALFGMAACHLGLGRLRSAAKLLVELKKRDPFSGYRFLLEARLYNKLGEPKKALTSYKEALIIGGCGIELYEEAFKILEKEKNDDLFEFFKQRYDLFKKDFYGKQKKFLSKENNKDYSKKLEIRMNKIDKRLSPRDFLS